MICLLAGCVEPDRAKRQYVVGIASPTPYLNNVVEGFKDAMGGFEREDGVEIIYIYNGPIAEEDKMRAVIQDMVDRRVDMVLTLGLPPTLIAKELTARDQIPVVFAPVYNPVGSGVVSEVGIHKCNMTGIQIGSSSPKALQLLLEIKPSTKRILIPYDLKASASKQNVIDLRVVAGDLGVELVLVEVSSRKELAAAFEGMGPDIDAIWLLNSFFLVNNIDLYSKASLMRKIPVASGTSQVEEGVLVSYGQNLFNTGRSAARLARRILLGTKPRDLPIETAEYFLGINLKVAGQIGLDIPDYILQQADLVVK